MSNKDVKLLEELLKAVTDRTYDDKTEEYKLNLRKYVLSSCLLKLCDKVTSSGAKYCRLSLPMKYQGKPSSHLLRAHERVLYYTHSDYLEPKDVGLKETDWQDVEYPNSVMLESHRTLRHQYYNDSPYNSRLELMINILYEQHYDLLVETFAKMDKSIEIAKKRSVDGKQRGKLKSAITFTKAEQILLAKRVYREFLTNELSQVEKNIRKAFNCKFEFEYTNLTCTTDSYILTLATEGKIEIDPSGKMLYDELNSKSLKADKILTKWLDDTDPLFRRFALTFSQDKLTLGLLDSDEIVRLNATLRSK